MLQVLASFAPLFSERVWQHAQLLLVGAFPQLRAEGPSVRTFRRRAGWYRKAHPTFADALALVRKELWAREQTFYGPPAQSDTIKVPLALVERLTEAAYYAA